MDIMIRRVEALRQKAAAAAAPERQRGIITAWTGSPARPEIVRVRWLVDRDGSTSPRRVRFVIEEDDDTAQDGTPEPTTSDDHA